MIKLKKLHDNATMPTLGSQNAACYDLYTLEDVVFGVGEVKLVKTGWAAEVPDGYRLNLYVRSSTPISKGFILANSVGIIDNDYRGELLVQLMNINSQENSIKAGTKFAQMELVRYEPIQALEVVDELSVTQRGTNGIGSTGN